MTTVNSCSVCCESYNKSTRAKVVCSVCEYGACRSCCEQYILSKDEPVCMNAECKQPWSLRFLKKNFTDKFMKTDLRNHTKNVIFEREKLYLPDTQTKIKNEDMFRKINAEIRSIQQQIHELYTKRENYKMMYNALKDRNNRNETEDLTQDWEEFISGSNESNVDKKKKAVERTFVRRCPADECRGYLSSQWKCGLCNLWTCPECHELKGETRDCEHTCKPENVESAKLIAKDSKPCPKCGCLIHKLTGCDQMWCTVCHVAFSWVTGKIEHRIHNPHYYEWARNRNGGVIPREQGDVECGRTNIDNTTINEFYLHVKKYESLIVESRTNYGGKSFIYVEPVNHIHSIIQRTAHNIALHQDEFIVPQEKVNDMPRMKYMRGKIDENTFKTYIERYTRNANMKREMGEVIQFQITATTDIVHRLFEHLKNPVNINKEQFGDKVDLSGFIQEFEELMRQCNVLLEEIGEVYKSKNYLLCNKNFRFEKQRLCASINRTVEKGTGDYNFEDAMHGINRNRRFDV